MSDDDDYELIAQRVSELFTKVEGIDQRLLQIEGIVSGLETVAIATSNALEDIAQHWSAVHKAMTRKEWE